MIVDMRMLPDENGQVHSACQVRIHLMVREMRPVSNDRELMQEVVEPYSRGKVDWRLACESREPIASNIGPNVTRISPRSAEPGAVTCPECKASNEYKEMMRSLNEKLDVSGQLN